jgi:hypothetical protein
MRTNILLAMIVSLLALPSFGQAPGDETYPLTVQVTHSEVIFLSSGSMLGPYSVIEATIDGRNYKLIGEKFANTKFSFGIKPAVLKVGKYKARVTEEKFVNVAQYFRQYEFQLADGNKLKFDVIGESED